MKRWIAFVQIITFISIVLVGCSGEPVKTENMQGGLVQEPKPTTDSIAKPSSQAEPTPFVDHVDPEYTKSENLLKSSDTITYDGICYSVQKVERTQSFGNRKLENLKALNDWIKVDKKGNLSGKEYYIFLTMKYTNTTDKEIEIIFSNGDIRRISSEKEVLETGSAVAYLDQLWTKGRKDEIHHWKLGPHESVTREVGYYCEGDDWVSKGGGYYSDCNRKYDPNLTWSLYYTPMYDGTSAEESLYIDLGLEVGKK